MDTSTTSSSGLLGRLFGRRKTSGTAQLARLVRYALALFGVVSVAYVLTSYYISTRVTRQSDFGTLAADMRETNRSYMEMRVEEQNLLRTRNLQAIDNHKLWFDKTMALIADSRNNPAGKLNDDKLADLQKVVNSYRKSFLAAAEAMKTQGSDETQGTQGALRNAAHAIEESVSAQDLPELEVLLLQMRRHEKDFMLRGDDKYVKQYAEAGAKLSRAFGQAKIDPIVRQTLRKDLSTYEKGFNDFVASEKVLNDALAPIKGQEAQIDKLVDELTEISTTGSRDASNASQNSVFVSAVALLSILTVLSYLLWTASRAANIAVDEQQAARKKAEDENEQLNNSVISILQSVHQLSQRDLTARAPVTTDVIGTVSDSINALAGETAKVLSGVTQIAGQVAQATSKVKNQADLVNETAAQERQGVEQMINSLADATQTMNQVAALAEQSNASAASATQATNTALVTVNDTVKGMESIRETIAETEKRIKRLGERSQEISGIVNLINTIAERTHVLALNASMQAAVAGEAGRGFAVVAEEVQRLAESSRNATQQIGTLVNNIQLETNETINTVNRTINQVVQGSEQAQRAGEQMRTTQEMTNTLVDMVRRIALASDQQKEMSAGLLQAVQRIGESTEQTARQIEAQNQETQTLQESARQLVDSVNVFKLPQAA